MSAHDPPPTSDDWVGVLRAPLPVAEASSWVVLPRCGAVVVFSGTSRDHSGGSGSLARQERREGVTVLEYEAYEDQVEPRLRTIIESMRAQWPTIGRVALLHRRGEVPVGESSVVVAVSSPHRDEAFVAARFGIDALKASVPIWKKETWAGGSAWGLDATPITDVAAPPAPVGARDGGGGAS